MSDDYQFSPVKVLDIPDKNYAESFVRVGTNFICQINIATTGKVVLTIEAEGDPAIPEYEFNWANYTDSTWTSLRSASINPVSITPSGQGEVYPNGWLIYGDPSLGTGIVITAVVDCSVTLGTETKTFTVTFTITAN